MKDDRRSTSEPENRCLVALACSPVRRSQFERLLFAATLVYGPTRTGGHETESFMRNTVLVGVTIFGSLVWATGCSDGRGQVDVRVAPELGIKSVTHPSRNAGIVYVDTAQDAYYGGLPIAFETTNGSFTGYQGSVTQGDTQFPLYATQNATPVAGDFNGDGIGDIALVSKNNWNTIPVAYNLDGLDWKGFNQAPTGFAAFPVAAGQAGAQVVAGDFDADGRDDLALTSGKGWNTIPIAFSTIGGLHATNNGVTSGDTSFPSEAASGLAVNSALPLLPVVGDFDHDGRADIALVGGAWNDLPIAFSNGDGTWRAAHAGASPEFFAYSKKANVRAFGGDYNGDGLADIALVDMSDETSVEIGFGQTNGSFVGISCPEEAWPPLFPAAAAQVGAQIVPGDYNDDGKTDLLSAGQGGQYEFVTALALSYTPGSSCLMKAAAGIYTSGFTAFNPVDHDTNMRIIALR